MSSEYAVATNTLKRAKLQMKPPELTRLLDRGQERKKTGRNKEQRVGYVKEKGYAHLFRPFLKAGREKNVGHKLGKMM